MSIRPIDIQISIQRSNDYTREANLQNQKPNINQLTNIQEFQYHIEHAQRRVVSTEHTFYKRVDREPKERQQSWQGNTGKNDKSNPEAKAKDERVESEVNETNKGINIDIKV
ncbi:MAG: hypothetical protein GX024_00640 [Clostridiales bacterium]|jgi:hypothetical protein|nr:hypothetical protein [Clostridiales bacterium]